MKTNKVFMDGDFNGGYESRVRKATGENTIISKKELADIKLQNERLKEDIKERSEAASLSNKDKRNLVDKIIQLESEKQELIAALKYAEGAFPDRFPNAKQMLRSLLAKHKAE